MKTLRILNAGLLAVGCAVIVTVSLAGTGAGQASGQAVVDRRRRPRRRRHRSEGAGSRRVGHRGDDRASDQVRQDRRDRRSRPLRRARSPEGDLQRLGPRLRARRFAEDAGDARQDRST